MRFIVPFLVLSLGARLLCAQNLQKPSAAETAELPDWAKELYSEQPNLFVLEQLYRDYYRLHPFRKSYHTQYYKRWKRRFLNYIDENGYVRLPDEQERARREQEYLQKQSPLRASNWSLVGPIQILKNDGTPGSDQANIYSIDQCAAQPSVLYCGTEPGEVYKSGNGGGTWSNVSMNINFGSGVTAVEVHPSNPNIALAGGNAGIFRTTDGGGSWTNVQPHTNFGVNELLLNPTDPQIGLAATDRGLYRSTDGGANWIQLFGQACYDVKCHPANASVVYLLKDNPGARICEFYRSADFGATWTLQSSGWYNSTDPARNNGGGRLAVSSAAPDRVYAYLIGEAKANDYGFIGLYRSDDAGLSWTLPNGPAGGPYTASHPNLAYGGNGWTYHQGFYNCALMASPVDADRLLIGGLNLWRSDDGGFTFSSVAGYVGGPLDMHVDMQDFRVVGNDYWITTDGGIYHSGDFFDSQPDFMMYGVHASDYWGFGSGWNEDVLVGGLYHNGNNAYHENYGQGNHLQLGGGEAPTGYVNPGNNRKTYFSDIGGRIIPLSLTDPIGNFSMSKSPNETYYAAESSEMEFHPHCYNIAYIGSEHGIWKTSDGGSSYTLLRNFGSNPNDQVKYIEISSSNPQIIYLNQQPASGSVGKLWKTTDGGNAWTQLALPAGNSRRMLLALNPENENELWIAYPGGANGNKVFRTADGGNTWSNLTSSALDNESVQSLVYIAGTDGGLYACTDRAVYYRNNASAWQLDNGGLPLYFNCNIARPFYRDGKLRIASYGKGIWESSLNEQPSRPIARISVDKLEQQVVCSLDSFHFSDYSFLNHQGAAWAWTFPGGSPASSALRNPTVYFPAPGTYMAALTIIDGNGQQDSDTLYVTVSNYNLQVDIQEDFQGAFPPAGWSAEAQPGGGQWALTSDAGGYGASTQSVRFDNYYHDAGGAWSDLRLAVDAAFSGSHRDLSFDVAYSPYGAPYSDTLEVLVSTDCGQSFTSIYRRGGMDLSTAPSTQNFFVPAASEWRTEFVNLDSFAQAAPLLVAFRNWGHYGNALYLDNINLVSAINANSALPAAVSDMTLYPNPVCSGDMLYVQSPVSAPAEWTLYDLNGKALARGKQELSAEEARAWRLPAQLPPAVYMLHIRTETGIWNRPLVVKP